MADYADDKQGAFEDIAEAGATIKLFNSLDRNAPANLEAPWEGSDDEGSGFDHVGVFVPLTSALSRPQNADPFGQACMIPALNMPTEVIISEGSVIERTDGTRFTVKSVVTIDPTGADPIVYICEVTPWPVT